MAESDRDRRMREAIEKQRKKNQSDAARQKRDKKSAWWDRMKDGG